MSTEKTAARGAHPSKNSTADHVLRLRHGGLRDVLGLVRAPVLNRQMCGGNEISTALVLYVVVLYVDVARHPAHGSPM